MYSKEKTEKKLGVYPDVIVTTVEKPRKREEISLDELMHHATHQRRTYTTRQHGENVPQRPPGWFKFFDNARSKQHDATVSETSSKKGQSSGRDDFKTEINRELRNANWLAMFALITTDVIGPNNAGYAFSTVGYVGGFLLYFTFGVCAIWGSFLLLNLFLRLDSDKYPVKTFGDLMEVFYGKWGRYFISFAQIFQCIFITATNVIANAQSMTLLTGNNGDPLCFIVSIVIWTVIGALISIFFRSFKNLSYLAFFDAGINFLVVFLTMGFIAHSPPNYASAASTYGYDINPPAPIRAVAIVSAPLYEKVNGAMNMVFAWSGLMIFVEFMAEMRNPFNFWKSFMLSETIILCVYVTFGAFVYGLQGQYTLPVAFQGVSRYDWQSVGNGLSLWTYTMASVVYLNVAMKVAYWLLFENWFKGPKMGTFKGRICWTILQITAWILAFVIGTAIPQVQTLQALIGAALLLQFSYTFPPLMQFTLDVRCDAAADDPPYRPGQLQEPRIDTWRSAARWKRGLFTGKWWLKAINLTLGLAGLATSGLGIWGSVLTIEQTFQDSAATSFGCTAPV